MSKKARTLLTGWIITLSLLGCVRAQVPSQPPSPDEVETAVKAYFAVHTNEIPDGAIFIAANRIGPAFGLPTDDEPHSLIAIDQLANPAIRSPVTVETVGAVYDYILTFRQLPTFTYSKSDQHSLTKFNHLLFKRRFILCAFADWLFHRQPMRKPSRAYLRYFQFAEEVAQSKDRYNAALKNNQPPSVLASIEAQTTTLNQEWTGKGQKEKLERAMAEYGKITAKNPVSTWHKIALDYSAANTSVGGKRIPLTDLEPKIGAWPNDVGWSTVPLSAVNGVTAHLRVKNVAIHRPWLNENVFGALEWQWVRSAPLGKDHIVSDGLGLKTVMTRSKTISLLPQRLIIGQYQGTDGKWFQNPFLVGYFASVVSVTPRR